MINELKSHNCIASLKRIKKQGVFSGEATQVSPKLGKSISRLFPDTNTPIAYIVFVIYIFVNQEKVVSLVRIDLGYLWRRGESNPRPSRCERDALPG